MNRLSTASPPAALQTEDPARWRESGARTARAAGDPQSRGHRVAQPDREQSIRAVIARAARDPKSPNAEWVLDNARLIRGSEKAARAFAADLNRYPAVSDAAGSENTRVLLLAREYLRLAGNRFEIETLVYFLEGCEDSATLSFGEIWGIKSALQLELTDRLIAADPSDWPVIVSSLRTISEAAWKDLVESASRTHRVLRSDPAAAYPRMDYESRERYWNVVEAVAKSSPATEREVAQAAVALCRRVQAASDGSRAATRRTHVGYYLVDRGLRDLEAAVGYHPPLSRRVARLIQRYPASFYLASIELLTFVLVVGVLLGLDSLTPVLAGLLLLLLPASQAAVDFVNNLTTSLLPPRALPKLDYSEGIPAECATLVAVPTLLLSEAQIHDLALDLEIRFLANRDPNLYFALLTDLPDADSPVDERNSLVEVCRRLIEGMNRRYRTPGYSPFLLLHRDRAYNESEGRWMGWERKRGKLLDLNKLLRGAYDAFPVKAGDTSVFPQIRYVITLDSDTTLPRDSAARLIGAIAHPLNRAVTDPGTRMVVEGYGILQPRIGISIHSSSRSRLAALYSGQTGFDIYTRAVSDVYQDLFGEGIFTGKGIYEVDILREVLEFRFPENALLSHDLIEGAYTRAGLASDIELIDDYPSHFSAYSRRKHRWVRGDWQIMRWLRAKVPDYYGRLIPNPINLISQWKILDNLRRSLLEPALLVLFLGSWLYLPGAPGYWTSIALALFLIPAWSGLLFTLLRAPRRWRTLPAWTRETLEAFAQGNAIAVLHVMFLLHQALLSVDAIARSLGRVLVTRRKLLEWETAAEAEADARPKSTVDRYLEWTPAFAAAIGTAVWLIRPAALPAAAPVLALWLASRPFSGWLNRRPGRIRSPLKSADQHQFRTWAESMCRFFQDWSSPATNWLIPDSVSEEGVAELRLSPTNLGLLLNARVAAVHLGTLPLAEFTFQTQQTLDRVLALEKHRGHLFNWYDVSTLAPLDPRFVSTVDSGNLAASLWTLKQAALAFAGEPPSARGVNRSLAAQLARIAATCERLVREMDFRFLYEERRKALSVGYDAGTQRLNDSYYDLLASEAPHCLLHRHRERRRPAGNLVPPGPRPHSLSR